jgi:hypothetical protein
MREFIVVLALCIVLAAYAYLSIKERSWFNILTPQLVLAVPAIYLAQIVRLQIVDEAYSAWLYAYIYSCYALPIVVFVLTLVHIKMPLWATVRSRPKVRVLNSPYVFLLIGIILFAPIAIEFGDQILNPRAIYEKTRTGYGLNFFLSTTFAVLGFALFMFKRERGLAQLLAVFIFCCAFGLAHGSKGQIFTFMLVPMLYWRYVAEKRISFAQMSVLVVVLGVLLSLLFYLFTAGVELGNLIEVIAGYSDYTSNGLMVMADNRPALFGRIFFEDNVFSRVPRLIYPEKPKDFGSFFLSQSYFPEAFELDQGVPALGVGLQFADYKWLALPMLCLGALFMGLVTKRYIVALRKFQHPGDFIVLMFLSGVTLLPLGVGFFLPEHILIAWVVSFCLRFRIMPSRQHTGFVPSR